MGSSLAEFECGYEVLPALRGRVMVVSQDPVLSYHYVQFLRGLGVPSVLAASYESGLKRLKSEVFDVIIVDQGGPNFEGRCIVESAKESTQRTPIVVVTRKEDFACHLVARRLGAIAYWRHPAADRDLERVVSCGLRSLYDAS